MGLQANLARVLGTAALCAALIGVAGQGASAEDDESVLLYDFEEGVSFSKVWSPDDTVAVQSKDWAASGQASLRIDVNAWNRNVHGDSYYPGVSLSLPRQRDWSAHDYLTLDVRLLQDSTGFDVLVQRSGSRSDRVSRTFRLPAGESRLWLSIPKLLGSGERARTREIASVEFHLTRVPHAATVFVDNVRLRRGEVIPGGGRAGAVVDEVMAELQEERAAVATAGQPTDYLDPLDRGVQRSRSLDDLMETLRRKKATQALASFIEARHADTGYAVLAADAQERIQIRGQGIPSRWQASASLDMMRGETRSFQMVLLPRPGMELRKVHVVLPDLIAAGGERIASGRLTLEVVGYVHLPGSAYMTAFGAPAGWYPDPVLEWPGAVDVVAPREVQPLLVTVSVPRDHAPGVYAGTILVQPEGAAAFELPLSVRVRSIAAPPGARLPHLLGIGQKENPQTGKTDRDPEFFLSYRLNPNYHGLGNIYDRRQGIYDQTANTPLDITTLKRYVDAGMNRFNLVEIMHRQVEAACEGGEEGVQRYLDRIFSMYTDDYMAALVAAGLADKAVFYGLDEYPLKGDAHARERERLTRVFGALRERYGKYGVKVATTADDWVADGALDLPVDIWIPNASREGVTDNGLARMAREEKNAEIWWYTIAWEIWSPPAFSRAIPWATFGQGFGGWLYYNLNGPWQPEGQTLGKDPLTDWQAVSTGAFARHGSGSLVYHDADHRMRPSLRLVNIREGMFDYDLLAMLADDVARLDRRRAALTFAQRADLERARDIAQARNWQAMIWPTIAVSVGQLPPGWALQENAAELAASAMDAVRTQSLDLLERLQNIQ